MLIKILKIWFKTLSIIFIFCIYICIVFVLPVLIFEFVLDLSTLLSNLFEMLWFISMLSLTGTIVWVVTEDIE